MHKKQFSIIAHALGVDIYKEKLETLPDQFYRNKYIAGEGHRSWKTLMELFDKGWAGKQHINSDDTLFYITPVGEVEFRKHYAENY